MATDINLATYTGNPSTNPRDAVRLLIGDTDPTSARFKDAEIDYFLAQAGDDPQRAAQACMAVSMASVASSAGTRTIGKTTITDRRGEAYKAAAAALESASPVGGTGVAVALFDTAGASPAIFDYAITDNPQAALPGSDLSPADQLNGNF